ncbi:hypothetical protein IWW45_004123 [Coemansia sp. RSA 485]|nr:hypothetical protein IWW45_004123 [Coemansia sp. RSA 485]
METAENAMQRPFDRLPDEVLVLILVWLDPAQLDQAKEVDRRWKRIILDDSSWRRVLVQSFGRLPFNRVDANSWKAELNRRTALKRLWYRTSQQQRIGLCPKIGMVDRVVTNGSGWALAVSMAAVAMARIDVHKGSNVRAQHVFGDGRRGTALATRVDGVCWGLASGECIYVRLTQHGTLGEPVRLADHGSAPVLAVAGCLDALAQTRSDWRSLYGVQETEHIASADSQGSVRVWSNDTGELVHLLRADGAPLVRVTWTYGAQYIIAASPRDLYVWDLLDGAHKCSVFPLPRRCGAIVMLTGDPFAPEFIVATEKAGVWRMDATDGTVLAEFAPPDGDSFATLTVASFAVAAADSGKTRGESGQRSIPGLSKHAALRSGPVSASSSVTSLGSAGVLRVAFSPATPSRKSSNSTRLLVVGDASGSLFLFDADAKPSQLSNRVLPLRCWPQLHRLAVSAVDVSPAIIASSGRDGQLLFTEPLSGETLGALRCKAGGRSSAFSPWIGAIRPPLVSAHTRIAVILAQLLAARTQEQWALQTAGRVGDRLDREDNDDGGNVQDDDETPHQAFGWDDPFLDPAAVDIHGHAANNPNRDEVPGFFAWNQIDPVLCQTYPTFVSQVVVGNTWVLVANGTHVQTCIVEKPPPARTPKKRRGGHSIARFTHKMSAELEHELEVLRVETEEKRALRIEQHEQRQRIESEFGNNQLGLSAEEQIEYAIWLSANQEQKSEPPVSASSSAPSSASTSTEQYSIQGMTEDEQLQYALLLSASTEEYTPST